MKLVACLYCRTPFEEGRWMDWCSVECFERWATHRRGRPR
jgi:hypothetical protein